MRKARTTHFTVERLHWRTDDAFAVIAMPSGAIALRPDGRPFMRLDRVSAAEIALDRTRKLRRRLDCRPLESAGASVSIPA